MKELGWLVPKGEEIRLCCGCDRKMWRLMFSEKEWDLDERWCVGCVAEDTAYEKNVGLLPVPKNAAFLSPEREDARKEQEAETEDPRPEEELHFLSWDELQALGEEHPVQVCPYCVRDRPLSEFPPKSRGVRGAFCNNCRTSRSLADRDRLIWKKQRCGRCKFWLRPDHFAPSVRGKNGHYCRDCARAYRRQRASNIGRLDPHPGQ